MNKKGNNRFVVSAIIFLGVLIGIILSLAVYVQSNHVSDQRLPTKPSLSPRGLIVPHHTLVKNQTRMFLTNYPCELNCQIILLTPLHVGEGVYDILMGPDELGLNQLIKSTYYSQATDSQLVNEHAISDTKILLHQSYPSFKSSYIMVSNYVPQTKLDAFAMDLAKYLAAHPKVRLIISIDFSHYLLPVEAQSRDAQTLSILKGGDYAQLLALNDEYLDGRGALYLGLSALKNIQEDQMEIIYHTNSALLTQDNQPTTSLLFATLH